MRRLGTAAVSAAMVLAVSAGAVFAAPPTITVIDFSQFEAQAEADWLAECGFAVDVEFEGHIIVHEFDGGRLVEVDNWHTSMSYSANGKTFALVNPIAGPDHVWVGRDGVHYLATNGRSVFGGTVGRVVINLDTGAVVSSHGLAVDSPLDDICSSIAP